MAKRTKNSKNLTKVNAKQKPVLKEEKKSLPKDKLGKNNYVLAGVLAVISFISFWYFTPTNPDSLKLGPGTTLFNVSSLFLSGLIFYLFAFYKDKVSPLISGIVFFSLVLLSLSRMLFLPLGDYNFTEVSQVLTFEVYRNYSYTPLIIFGLISVWFYRNKFDIVISEDIAKLTVETTENTSFSKKLFQKLKAHKVPALVVLVAIIGLSSTILLHKLDDYDFWSDEKQVTQAAAGYYHTGEFQQWDFIKEKPVNGKEFDRNFPHLWLISQSYKVFGVNEWSSRIVSVLGGILFVLLGYFILTYFFKNKFIILLFLASFAFYPEEIILFRWTRMYGILTPYFLIQFTLAYKTLTTQGKFNFKNEALNSFFSKYLDFNYKYLLIFIPMTIFGYWVHKSTTFTLPALFIFIIYLAVTEKRPRFFIAIALGIIILIAGLIFFPRYVPTHVMTWFGKNNIIYYEFLYFFPLTKELALSILAIGTSLLYFIKKKDHRQKLTYFYIMSAFVLVLFVFVITYDISFRYVSFLVPVSMALSFYVLMVLAKTFLGKYFSYALAVIILLSSGVNFMNRYDDLYTQNFASKSVPSEAYKEIREQAKSGEAVFLQYALHYYLHGMDTTVTTISMRHQRKYKYDQFLKDINTYKSGWLEWDTQHAGNIDTMAYSYINHNFKKIHGKAIDDTWTEVYRYDSTMVITRDSFNIAQNYPTANLNTNYPFSISFWAKMTPSISGVPFTFEGYSSNEPISVSVDTINGFTFQVTDNKPLTTGKVIDNKWHHVVWQQIRHDNKSKEMQNQLYLDGKKLSEGEHSVEELIKFKIGLAFRGQMNEMRIYDRALSQKEIDAIYNNGSMTHISKLAAEGYYFEPMNFWSKK